MAEFHLAQLNVAKLKAPLDEPSMSGFVEALEPLNGLADGWPGFVWRLQTDAGDATACPRSVAARLYLRAAIRTGDRSGHRRRRLAMPGLIPSPDDPR